MKPGYTEVPVLEASAPLSRAPCSAPLSKGTPRRVTMLQVRALPHGSRYTPRAPGHLKCEKLSFKFHSMFARVQAAPRDVGVLSCAVQLPTAGVDTLPASEFTTSSPPSSLAVAPLTQFYARLSLRRQGRPRTRSPLPLPCTQRGVAHRSC